MDEHEQFCMEADDRATKAEAERDGAKRLADELRQQLERIQAERDRAEAALREIVAELERIYGPAGMLRMAKRGLGEDVK